MSVPDLVLVLLGYFNDFDCGNLVSHHSLKQVVQQPTRDSAILDLIVTNMHNLYCSPTIHAPLGSSDHNVVFWQPIALRQPSRIKSPKCLVRHYPPSGIDAFGRWVTTHDWFADFGFSSSVDDLASSFTTQLIGAINRIFPVKTIKLHATDKPWITPDQAYDQRPTESISQRQHPSLALFEIQSPTRNSEEEEVFLQEQSTAPKE